MVLQNVFLLNMTAQAHEDVADGCFCGRCRNYRLQRVLDFGYTKDQLHHIFTNALVEKENTRLNRLFRCTIEQIVHGMAYRMVCLENTNYKNFKSWAKHQREFNHLSQDELDNFCFKLNETCNVFNSWAKIVDNLTDERMIYIDARRLSIRQFYLAKKIGWCLEYNESLRPKGRTKNELPYSEEKYNAILQNIVASGIMDDVDNNPQVVTALGGRLQTDMVRRALGRYRPY